MKNLIKLSIILLSLNIYGQRVKVIDTSNKYKSDIQYHDEGNDCSVRAIAEAFDITYDEALLISRDGGRKRGNGMTLRNYVKLLKTTKSKNGQLPTPMSPRDFIDKIAQKGNSYILVTLNHTFVIEEYRGDFVIKGNFGDHKSNIIGFAYVVQS
tara:strand:- start:192 stop:653 length:462 start_codon:yes stop_codon:yes gene_type:complete